MNRKLGATLILAALFATGCARITPTASARPATGANTTASEYKHNFSAPADAARVYVLPTFSTGLYGVLGGRASIRVHPEGVESVGATLGQTTAHSFIAFDVGPGSYDFYAQGDAIGSHAKSAFNLKAGKVYFLRPVFYRSGKDLAAERANGGLKPHGLDFDNVRPEVARKEIVGLKRAPLTPSGQAFLKASLEGSAPARQAAVVVPAPAATSAAAPAGAAQAQPQPALTRDQVIEKKLEILRDLYHKGLITKDEYDAKRKELLNAF